MNILPFATPLLALVFLGVGGALATVAIGGYRGTLPYLSPIGLRTPAVRVSESAWSVAHRAVWPLFAVGAAMAFFHGLALIPASLMNDVGAGGYVGLITVAGAIVIAALWVLAGKAAKAALNTTPHD